MFRPQTRKYFRYRFSRLMVFIFLLISPAQASSGPKSSCGELAAALGQTPQYSAELFIKLFQCLKEIPAQINSWKTALDGVSVNKPELSSLSSPEGLLHLSAYLLFESFKLHDRAMNLDVDYNMHRATFEALQRELNMIKDFIENELIPKSEKGEIFDLQKVIMKLLDVLFRYSEVLRHLTEAIHRDTKKAASERRWSAAYATGATALCAGVLAVGNFAVLVTGGTCVASAGAVMLNVKSYIALSDTLEKLGLLLEDTKEMSEDIAKYHRHLLRMSI